MLRKIVSCIPNTITLLNLLSGCAAIVFAFHHSERIGAFSGLEWGWIMIGAAALFDFCDGASARALRAYSAIGKELDSLSDLVSFGVAPAMLVLNLMQDYSSHPWLCYAAMFIPAMGALRLAKFNVDTTQTTSFRGLPIPANAIFWIGMCGWVQRYGYPGTAVMVIFIVLVSLAMVGNMRMFSLKFKNFDLRENFSRYVILLAAVAFVVFYGVSGFAWTILLYMLISMFTRRHAE
ncbi:MAG: CDP-diacylglycerol--serine O-phosphatidyltransferase [Muribaculaceae bacterium]|nr:CDP-diacylglycerol--serine O-phosphatidyltransferase [Muribaculaceae bacterium]